MSACVHLRAIVDGMHAHERGAAETVARWLGLGLVTEIALPIGSPGTVDE